MIDSKVLEKEAFDLENSGFSLEIMKILKKLLILEIKNTLKIFHSFEELKQIPEFNLYLLFQALHPSKQETITPQNLIFFLKSKGINIENFPFLQKKLFGENKAIIYREFSLFFSKIGGLDTQIQPKPTTNPPQKLIITNIDEDLSQNKSPNLLQRRNTTTPLPNKNLNSYDAIIKRKNSQDYVEYLLKVRNTEAKLAKIQSDIQRKAPISPYKKNLESFFYELLHNQFKIEKDIESLKEDLSLKSDISYKSLLALFDSENKGFITINNLRALIPTGSNCNEKDLFMFIRRFAKSNRNFLGYFSL